MHTRPKIAVRILAAAICVSAAILLATGGPASAAAPSGPTGCQIAAPSAAARSIVSAQVGQAIPDNGTFVVVTVDVAGLPNRIWDVDVLTRIRHEGNGDLEILLRSPTGTEATLSTRNGGGSRDVLNGTRWDDQARDPITDIQTTSDVLVGRVAPEEALSVFVGEDPNGRWSLLIRDVESGRAGTIDGWGLEIATVTAPVIATTTTQTSGEAKLVPSVGSVESQIAVSGALGPLVDAGVLTRIRHTRSSDLRITLRSPAGTTILLTAANGGGSADAYNGTRWDDQAGAAAPAGAPITDTPIGGDTPVPLAGPQGPMSAFAGEDPNGTWTLTVTDTRLNQDGGALIGWSIETATASCRADLVVQSAVSPVRPVEGKRITLTASVANVGPDIATATTLALGLPSGSAIVTAAGAGITCVPGLATSCQLERIAPGAKRDVTIVFVPPRGVGTVLAPLAATSRETDVNPADNRAVPAIRIWPNLPTPVARSLRLFGRTALWPSSRFRFSLSRAASVDASLFLIGGKKPIARVTLTGRAGVNVVALGRITPRRLTPGAYTLRLRPRSVIAKTRAVSLSFKVLAGSG